MSRQDWTTRAVGRVVAERAMQDAADAYRFAVSECDRLSALVDDQGEVLGGAL